MTLVLGRKPNESVDCTCKCGEKFKVIVVEICSSNKVRLGFDAPPETRFLRNEITEAIEREKAKP